MEKKVIYQLDSELALMEIVLDVVAILISQFVCLTRFTASLSAAIHVWWSYNDEHLVLTRKVSLSS